MQLPTSLLKQHVSRSTSAVANTEVGTDIVTIPGAGQRFRLWSVTLIGGQTNTGNVNIRIADGAVSVFAVVAVAPGSPFALVEIPGGLAMTINSDLFIRDISNVATQGYQAVIGYTVEQT